MLHSFLQRAIELFQQSYLVRNSHILRAHILSPLFDHAERLSEIYYNFRVLPNAIAIENTTSCNRNCPYCPHSWQQRASRQMPFSLFRKIVDDLSDIPYMGKIQFAPLGEPLLDERLVLFVSHVRQKLPKSRILILTNGDLLTLPLFNELSNAGANQFDISDHYVVAENRYVIKEPKHAIETYNLLDADKKCRIVFLTNNYDRIRRIDRFHNRSGLVPLENSVAVKRLDRNCSFPESIMTITHNGEVLLCARQWNTDVTFGNLATEHIADIWSKPYFKSIRSNLRKGNFELEICRECRLGYMPEPESLAKLRDSQPGPA